MIYLVDANVLSEPTRPAPSRKVIDWLSANEQDIVVDSMILGELYIGILALPRGASGYKSSSGLKPWSGPSIAFRGMRRLPGVGRFWWWI